MGNLVRGSMRENRICTRKDSKIGDRWLEMINDNCPHLFQELFFLGKVHVEHNEKDEEFVVCDFCGKRVINFQEIPVKGEKQ